MVDRLMKLRTMILGIYENPENEDTLCESYTCTC